MTTSESSLTTPVAILEEATILFNGHIEGVVFLNYNLIYEGASNGLIISMSYIIMDTQQIQKQYNDDVNVKGRGPIYCYELA